MYFSLRRRRRADIDAHAQALRASHIVRIGRTSHSLWQVRRKLAAAPQTVRSEYASSWLASWLADLSAL